MSATLAVKCVHSTIDLYLRSQYRIDRAAAVLLVADRRRHAHCTQRSLAPRCREDPACAPASCWLLPPPCRVSTLQAACVAHKTPHNALLSAVLWAPPVVATPARGSANGMLAAMSQTTERQEKRVQTVPAIRNATDGTGEKHALVQDARLDRRHLLDRRHRQFLALTRTLQETELSE